jgi:hypothetical protein
MSIAENILFGTPRHPDFQPARLADNPEIVALLRDVGLLDELREAGAKVAALMVEIFADVAPDSELFEQYSFISAEDLPEFQALVSKYNQGRDGGDFRPRQGAPAGAHLPARQVASSTRHPRRVDAATHRAGAPRIHAPLRRPRRHLRILRA